VELGSSLGLFEDFLVRGLFDFSLVGESVDCLFDALGKSAESRVVLLFDSMYKQTFLAMQIQSCQ